METTVPKSKKTSNYPPHKKLKQRVVQSIEKNALFQKNATIILGLSGGPDSVFLLDMLVSLKKDGIIKEVVAAHLDHAWRIDSPTDVLFCKQLAATYMVPFVSETLYSFAPALKWNGSKEEIGRKARRAFLEKIMHQYNANAIALAHHQDDQLETFFIRLMRGASLTGLCGMQEKNGYYIRPLLEVNKKDIIAYLDIHSINYLTDPTNYSHDYLRNRIRTTILPALRKCDDRFDQNSLHTIHRLQETEKYLAAQTVTLFKVISSPIGISNRLMINYTKLLVHPRIMQYRLLVYWFCWEKITFPPTEAFLAEIIRFLHSTKSTQHRIYPTWTLVKEKKSSIYIHKIEKADGNE